jgi:hypothetical protein
MKFFENIVLCMIMTMAGAAHSSKKECSLSQAPEIISEFLNSDTLGNNCVDFSVSSGTGCDWMCTYCANRLGTNNYYFTDGICKYQSGICVGNPQVGVIYTCCSI